MMKQTGTLIGTLLVTFATLVIKTVIVFFALAILRRYGVPIFEFTFWEVFLLRWAISCFFPTNSNGIDK